jgi:hypothetical protein
VFQAAQSNPPEKVFVPPAQAGEPPAPTVQPARHSSPSGRGRIGGATAEAAISHATARGGALSGTTVGAEIEREFHAEAGAVLVLSAKEVKEADSEWTVTRTCMEDGGTAAQ